MEEIRAIAQKTEDTLRQLEETMYNAANRSEATRQELNIARHMLYDLRKEATERLQPGGTLRLKPEEQYAYIMTIEAIDKWTDRIEEHIARLSNEAMEIHITRTKVHHARTGWSIKE